MKRVTVAVTMTVSAGEGFETTAGALSWVSHNDSKGWRRFRNEGTSNASFGNDGSHSFSNRRCSFHIDAWRKSTIGHY